MSTASYGRHDHCSSASGSPLQIHLVRLSPATGFVITSPSMVIVSAPSTRSFASPLWFRFSNACGGMSCIRTFTGSSRCSAVPGAFCRAERRADEVPLPAEELRSAHTSSHASSTYKDFSAAVRHTLFPDFCQKSTDVRNLVVTTMSASLLENVPLTVVDRSMAFSAPCTTLYSKNLALTFCNCATNRCPVSVKRFGPKSSPNSVESASVELERTEVVFSPAASIVNFGSTYRSGTRISMLQKYPKYRTDSGRWLIIANRASSVQLSASRMTSLSLE
mmetsp:Transcript_28962/g.59333  ORF Transcript_28962/g.59333 Transcript_28962/m.59333 type:complete len:277 (-) Transcript_28962:5852-6682(-)